MGIANMGKNKNPPDPRAQFAGLVTVVVAVTVGFIMILVSIEGKFKPEHIGDFFNRGNPNDFVIILVVSFIAYGVAYASYAMGGSLLAISSIIFFITWQIATWPEPDPLKTERLLFLVNDCDKRMEVALWYYNSKDRDRRYDGWWQIEPRSKHYLKRSSGGRLRVRGDDLYYYARTLPYGDYAVEGFSAANIRGEDVSMTTHYHPISNERKVYELRLPCF
jgi:hypothetical protein